MTTKLAADANRTDMTLNEGLSYSYAGETPKKKVRYVALDGKVLCVAIKGEVNDWSAYIGAVPGVKHSEEAEEVAKRGTKLDYWIAARLFPDFELKYRWRE